ncbi:cholesterol 25-hydroxylase-like protein 2 [Festucalex cinctus]
MFFPAEAASSRMSGASNVTGGRSGSSLVLQPAWDYLRQNHHDLLRSPLFPVALSVSTYFFLVGVYTALDLLAPAWPSVNRYRLHPDRPVTWPGIGTTLGVTVYNHLLYIFPAAVGQWLTMIPKLIFYH